MMLMSAVVAVALGLAPVKESSSAQLVRFDEAAIAQQIGRYEQFVGKDGLTHIRGFDQLGRSYDLTIDGKGHVEGRAGSWDVSFQVADAG